MTALIDEMRLLLRQVQAERRALITIVIRHGDLPMLHEVAALLEEQQTSQMH